MPKEDVREERRRVERHHQENGAAIASAEQRMTRLDRVSKRTGQVVEKAQRNVSRVLDRDTASQ